MNEWIKFELEAGVWLVHVRHACHLLLAVTVKMGLDLDSRDYPEVYCTTLICSLASVSCV